MIKVVSLLLNTWWFLEPFIATISFAVWINLYWYYERQFGVSSITNFKDTLHLSIKGGPLFQSLVCYWFGIGCIQLVKVHYYYGYDDDNVVVPIFPFEITTSNVDGNDDGTMQYIYT